MSILRSAVALLGLVIAVNAQAAEINVVTDRSDYHVKPLFKLFEEQTGIKVNAAYVEEGGLVPRLTAKPTEGDVVITTDSAVLSYMKSKGMTRSLPTDVFKNLAPQFKNSDYVATSYRVRSIVIRNEVDTTKQALDYDDLANGKFRVCMRPLTHAYNINLVSQMIADKGEAYARKWVAGVKQNLALPPQGSDRKQGELVAKGECDITLMNSYYYGLMLTNNSQRQYGSKIKLYYPEQNAKGSYVLISGAALTKTNNPDAVKLIQFMLSPIAQNFISHVHYEYPVLDDIELPTMVQGFAEGQPGVVKGRGKFNFVDLEKIAQSRDLAVKIVTEIQGK